MILKKNIDDNSEYLFYENIDLQINDLLTVKELNTINDCLDFLDKSYASAFSYDKINKICYFKISFQYVKSTVNYNINNLKHKIDENFITVIKKNIINNGIICPTYINHLVHFKKLCNSIRYISDEITFVIVFSSLFEAINIMNQVYPILNKNKNIKILTLIFDVEYNNLNKFNYQCCKKLWALDILEYNNLLILDSDFEFINKINIYDEINNNSKTIHITNTYNLLFDFDKKILDNINNLLNINSNIFPLNLYWFINKQLFKKFIDYLISKINTNDYINFILNSNNIYFEIVMYNLFLINFYKDTLNIIDYTELSIKYQKYFLFDMPLINSEIKKYKANIAIAKYINTDKSLYLIKIHNDR